MVPPPNRRRAGHARLPIRVPAVTEPIGLPGEARGGEAQDLSPGGVQVRLERALAPGAPVRVTLRFSQRPPLTLIGTVAWVQPQPEAGGWALGIRLGDELPGEIVAEIADAEYPPWEPSPHGGAPPEGQ
jgi:hypothetical protein